MILLNRIIMILILLGTLKAGEYADAFILASIYPHAQSLGQSTVGLRLSSGHALNNPAGYAHGNQKRVSLAYDQFNGLSSNYGMEFQVPVQEKYVLGITIIHSSISDLFNRPNLSSLAAIDRRDSVLFLAGQSGELIQYREDAVFVSLARQFEFELNLGWKFFKIPFTLPVGLSVKYLDKLLVENRGIGSGIDFGAQLYFNLAGMTDILKRTEFSVGLFLSDILNTPVYWSTEHQDAIKRNFIRGYSLSQNIEKYSSQLIFSRSVQSKYQNKTQYGFEIKVKDMVSIRGGHNGYESSFGLGIGLKKFIIAYSFSHHELAAMQKIEINYHFR